MAKQSHATPKTATNASSAVTEEKKRNWFNAFIASTFLEPFTTYPEEVFSLSEREINLRRRSSLLRIISLTLSLMIILIIFPIAILGHAIPAFTETMIGELAVCLISLAINLFSPRSSVAGIFFVAATLVNGFSYAYRSPDGLDVQAMLLLATMGLTISIAGLVLPLWMMWTALVPLIAATTYAILTVKFSQQLNISQSDTSSRLMIAAILFIDQGLGAILLSMYSGMANAGMHGAVRAIEREHELTALKDQFLIDANHELRTPIMAWYANIEVLSMLANRATPEQRTRLVTRALEAGNLVRRLLTTMLDASVLESTIPRLALKPVQVAPLIHSLLETFDPRQIGEPGLEDIAYASREVAMTVPADLWIYADEDRLRQILTNLITNALKYSDSSTPIAIVAAPDSATSAAHARQRSMVASRLSATGAAGDSGSQRQPMANGPLARISVRDYGLGVPPRDVSKLFQRFVRLERDIAGPVRGTGVGLYLCKMLVEAMGGRIWVESSGRPGEGSTFIFTIPLADGAVESRSASANTNHNGHGSSAGN